VYVGLYKGIDALIAIQRPGKGRSGDRLQHHLLIIFHLNVSIVMENWKWKHFK
jgi:hypothetical protein